MSARRQSRVWCAAAAWLAGLLAGLGGAAAHPHVWVSTETEVLFEQGAIVGLRHRWTFDEFYSAMAVQGLDTNNDGIYDRKELAELAKVNIDGLRDFSYFTNAQLAGQGLKFAAPKDYWLEQIDAPERPDVAVAPAGQPPVPVPTVAPVSPPSGAGAPSQPEPQQRGMWDRLVGWATGRSAGDRSATATPAAPAKPKVLSLVMILPLSQPVLAEAEGFNFTVADPSFFIAFETATRDPVKLGAGAPAGCKAVIGDSARPAEEAGRLGEAFARELGGQPVGLGFAKPVNIVCEPKS